MAAAAAAPAASNPCFVYPRIVDNEPEAETATRNANFANWKCCVCHEEDANLNGGTVAHDPTHPIHLYCLLTWAEQHQTCPSCRAPIDVSAILTLSKKCILASRQALNNFIRYCQGISKPTVTVYSGLGLIIGGWCTGLPLLSGLGWALQSYGITNGLQFGTARVPLCQEIYRFSSEISQDVANLVSFDVVDPKLEALKAQISFHPNFTAELPVIALAFESKDPEAIEQSLKKIRELADIDLWGDKYLRVWRCVSGAMIAYSGYRAAFGY